MREALPRMGTSNAMNPLAKYTRASLFAEAGKHTPVFVRFSTVLGNAVPPTPPAMREASRSNSTRTRVIGIWWELISRCFSSRMQ
ncbi:MAG: catalase [Nitrosospira sp.]